MTKFKFFKHVVSLSFPVLRKLKKLSVE